MEGVASVVGDHSDRLELSPQLSNGVLRSAVNTIDGSVGPHFQWSNYTYDTQHDRGQFSEDGDVGPLDEQILGILPVLHQGY